MLEGTHSPDALTLRSREWYAERGVDLRLGSRVLEIDRAAAEVVLVDGSRLGYERLVLATGSIPTLPPIRGLVRLDGRLHEAVHAFRSLDDCRRLDAAVPGARRAVVVGGGLLGLQVARALSIRGVVTEIVEGGEHLLRSQVGAAAGRIIARDLRRLGTQVYTGARAVRFADEGLTLDNGYTLETDLVVLTAGGRPSAALARAAGLDVRRGVVVDENLTTSDPRIHAVGDCAQRGDRTTGFVAPAWEQAEVLAAPWQAGRRRTSEAASSPGCAPPTSTSPSSATPRPPRARWSRSQPRRRLAPQARRRDSRIVAATLVGDLSRIGLITQLYDRQTRLAPHEPGDLLLGERPDTPLVLGNEAEVCACAGVTAGAIRACSSLEDVRDTTRATTGCGGCALTVRHLLDTRPSLEGAVS